MSASGAGFCASRLSSSRRGNRQASAAAVRPAKASSVHGVMSRARDLRAADIDAMSLAAGQPIAAVAPRRNDAAAGAHFASGGAPKAELERHVAAQRQPQPAAVALERSDERIGLGKAR